MKKGKWIWIVLVICFIAYCGKEPDESTQSEENGKVVTEVSESETNQAYSSEITEADVEEILAFAAEQSPKLTGKGYMIEDFPYGKWTSVDLIQHYMDIINGKISVNKSYVKEDKNGVHKLTIEDDEYIYYGELKDSKPEGLGVILKRTDYGRYCLEKVGYFKDGCLNGNALVFDISHADYGIIAFSEDYESDYSMGKRTGSGIEYSYLEFYDVLYYRESYGASNVISFDGIELYTDLLLRTEDIVYIGELKNGERHGQGVIVIGGKLYFVGKFKEGEYIKGKLYDDGTLLYDGEFKYEKYHGDGILYNSDGTVMYKGEFKNGDIK